MKSTFSKAVITSTGFAVLVLGVIGWYSYFATGQLISSLRGGTLTTEMLEQRQRVIISLGTGIAIVLVVLLYFIYRGIRETAMKLKAKEELDHKLIQSEKIYRSLSSNIPGSAITILDREERYILAEGDLLKKMGYEKENMPGKKISDIITAENYVYYKTLIDQVFAGETLFLEKRTLSGFDTLLRVVPLRDPEQIFAIMFVYIDVTELKIVQSELALLNETLEKQVAGRTLELQEANRELESFSYSVSHDLRAPLRAIIGYSEMLQEDYSPILDDAGRNMLSSISRNTSRMSQLIDDLLHFSKLGRTELSKEKVNMAKLVSSVVTELMITEANRKINIHQLSIEPSMADERLMRQVWLNLIGNALKYSRKKDVAEIEIGSFKENGYVYYYVKDNGAGFDMLYLDKLFGVFQRLHKAAEFEGTGIGLALVKRIIVRHHGEIGAEGKLNEGAKFYFRLPSERDKSVTLGKVI